jgi:predicted PurR-regulated permease PerM
MTSGQHADAAGGKIVRRRAEATPLRAIAACCIAATLWAGRDFFVALVLSLVLAVLLWPPCARLAALLRSRVLAAALSVAATMAAVGATGWVVGVQLSGSSDRLPEVLRLMARDIGSLGTDRARAVQRTRAALVELDRTVARVTGTDRDVPPRSGEAKPSIVGRVVDAVSTQALSISEASFNVMLQCGVVALLAFFLLCGGAPLVTQLQSWGQRRLAHPACCAHAMRQAVRQVRVHARVTLIGNAALGLGVVLGFAALGVPEAGMWGLVAAALHFVPYAGLALLMALAALEAYAAQSSLWAAALGAGYVCVLGIVVGTGLTVWLQGRSARVNSATLFAGTLLMATLWGAWGLVLGPLMVALAHLAWGEATRLHDASMAPHSQSAPRVADA